MGVAVIRHLRRWLRRLLGRDYPDRWAAWSRELEDEGAEVPPEIVDPQWIRDGFGDWHIAAEPVGNQYWLRGLCGLLMQESVTVTRRRDAPPLARKCVDCLRIEARTDGATGNEGAEVPPTIGGLPQGMVSVRVRDDYPVDRAPWPHDEVRRTHLQPDDLAPRDAGWPPPPGEVPIGRPMIDADGVIDPGPTDPYAPDETGARWNPRGPAEVPPGWAPGADEVPGPGFYDVWGLSEGWARYWLVKRHRDAEVDDGEPYDCAWGLSLWGPEGEPPTWAYRTYGQRVAKLCALYPNAVWTADYDRVAHMKAQPDGPTGDRPAVGVATESTPTRAAAVGGGMVGVFIEPLEWPRKDFRLRGSRPPDYPRRVDAAMRLMGVGFPTARDGVGATEEDEP